MNEYLKKSRDIRNDVTGTSQIRQFCVIFNTFVDPREDAGGLSPEYVLRIPSVS